MHNSTSTSTRLPKPEAARVRGRVIWFDDGKGFGFIAPDGGGPDVYVHFRNIDSTEKRRKLLNDQIVEFELADSGKGPAALNVRVIA